MKKIISFITLCSVVFISIVSLNSFFTKKAEAQNIGTLRNVVTSGFSFKKDLMLGDTDPDVKELQRVLNADIDTMIISDEAGGKGKETTYFGQLTKDAVVKFQNKYKSSVLDLNGILSADGKVNRATRTRLNLLIGVMNTYDSVGLPQSRVSTVVVTPAPVVVTPPAGPSMTVCNFINLLSSVGIVATDRANTARSTMGCPISNFVDLKVNGLNGPLTVTKNSSVTVSWTSAGMASCSNGGTNKTLSGSESFTMSTISRTFTFTCKTTAGASISDTVTVNISGTEPIDEEDPILLASSYIEFGYSVATYQIDTNVSTKAYLTYRTNDTDAKTVSMTSFESTRNGIISGLTPSTLYYYKVKIVDADGDEFTSAEKSAMTADSPDDNGGTSTTTTSDLTQRVLNSTDGAGIVTIAGAESMKVTSKLTLEAWVKPTKWSTVNGISGTRDQVIVAKGKIGENIDYALTLDNGRLVYSNNDASLWTCSPVIPLNQWTHVAVAVDESTSTLNLFINGTKIASSTTILTIASTTSSGATTTATTTTAICEGSRGVFNKAAKIDKSKGITNVIASFITPSATDNSTLDFINMTAQQLASLAMGQTNSSGANTNPTSNVYLGNFYPKMCPANNAVPKDNGFIGSLDDIRIWKAAKTEAEIKANMKKSVKGKTSLIGYYTFDDGFASDVSDESNTGAIKGSYEVIDDTTGVSAVVAPDYSMGEGFTIDEPCDPPPPPEPEEEEPDYNVQFAGQIMNVESCANSAAWRVVVQGCTSSPVAQVAPNAAAQLYPTREPSYYNGSSGIIVVNVPKNLAKPTNKTMVFGGTTNGAWDEMCSETISDKYIEKDNKIIGLNNGYSRNYTRSQKDPDWSGDGSAEVVNNNPGGPLTVNSFSYAGKPAKSAGRVKSWDLGKREVGTCIGEGKHRGGFIRNWF